MDHKKLLAKFATWINIIIVFWAFISIRSLGELTIGDIGAFTGSYPPFSWIVFVSILIPLIVIMEVIGCYTKWFGPIVFYWNDLVFAEFVASNVLNIILYTGFAILVGFLGLSNYVHLGWSALVTLGIVIIFKIFAKIKKGLFKIYERRD